MLEGLNDEQKVAVLTPGNVLVTACPGSGKTRVLTYKIALELQNIANSKRSIVAVTFTNRAAEEIKNRITRMDIEIDQLWAGTIHSFCLEWILRPYASYHEVLRKGFVIADEYKSEELLSALKEQNGIPGWQAISTRLHTDGSFAEANAAFHPLLSAYHSQLHADKLIDFDQLLYCSYSLSARYRKIRKTLNNLFHLICVDEYQDTQLLQYAILANILSVPGGKTSIFLVGDKDQAIYQSLGGVAKSVQEISREFGNIPITEKKLSGNYRSTQRIIDYYRKYQSTTIDIKSECAYATTKGLITFNQLVTRDTLVSYIARIIQENLDNGVPENEICVLAPRWQLVIPMGRRLKQALPNTGFDAIGLSPLIKNKENFWFLMARLFLTDPSPTMYQIRYRWANELLQEMDHLGIHTLLQVESRAKVLLRYINSIRPAETDALTYLKKSFTEILPLLNLQIDEIPTLQQHWDSFFESASRRLENPDLNYAKDTENFKRLFNHREGVVVNTCHGIKGEEFHTVIAFGLLFGYIPNWNEVDKREAAMRLLYVICSRSKVHLHLIAEKGRSTTNGNPYRTTDLLRELVYDYDVI